MYSSMGFCIFTELGNHRHHQFQDTYITPERNLMYLLAATPHPGPNLRQPLIYFLSLWICLFWTVHLMESYKMRFWVICRFRLASCSQVSLLQDVSVIRFFYQWIMHLYSLHIFEFCVCKFSHPVERKIFGKKFQKIPKGKTQICCVLATSYIAYVFYLQLFIWHLDRIRYDE